ncbi:unnamed protein product [Pneumocystis jirovecii]|uniref:Uncharacterized protein n=1 Tax=Pneumocystis jirovecii TaxID=42068 RepID=L0PHJ0_PNEJI|nr:unnamed protein product [Pneumocystis jirovecii]
MLFSWNEVALKHISRAKDLMDRRIPARISISPAESCLSGRIPIVDVPIFFFNIYLKLAQLKNTSKKV